MSNLVVLLIRHLKNLKIGISAKVNLRNEKINNWTSRYWKKTIIYVGLRNFKINGMEQKQVRNNVLALRNYYYYPDSSFRSNTQNWLVSGFHHHEWQKWLAEGSKGQGLGGRQRTKRTQSWELSIHSRLAVSHSLSNTILCVFSHH